MFKNNLYGNSSSEQSDQESDCKINPTFFKSAVFNNESLHKKVIKEDQNELIQQPEQSHLKPKMKTKQVNAEKIISNNSNVYTNSVKNVSSQTNLRRPLTAAYTFKLKTPVQTKKKNDPVSLFQQTSTAWKKDKFLTNRANNKEGRKLQLDKRNKFI